jgi:hypothetical protein
MKFCVLVDKSILLALTSSSLLETALSIAITGSTSLFDNRPPRLNSQAPSAQSGT